MKIKLANKLVALFLLFSLLPLSIVGWIAHERTANTIQTLQFEKLGALAEERANIAEALFYERTRDAALLVRSPEIAELLTVCSRAFASGGIDSPVYKQTEQERSRYLSDYAAELDIADLFLITANGDIVFSTGKRSDRGTNLRTGPYNQSALNWVFERAMNGDVTKNARVDIYPPLGAPAIFIAAPIQSSDGIAGILAFEIPAATIYSFAQDYIGLGSTGETVLASLRDDQAIFVASTRHDPEAAMKRSARLGSADALPIQKAAGGDMGFGEFSDYRGEKVLASWRYLPSMKLGMVLKIDKDEAFAPIKRLTQLFFFLELLTFLVVLIASMAMARSISRPIVSITRATTRMAAGDLSIRTNIQRSDEIGILSSAFNDMAGNLQEAHTESENNDWLQRGLSGLDDVMRGTKNLEELCTDIISYIARTLDVQVGTLSLVNEDRSRLLLAAGYAFKAEQGTAKEFRFGDGLIGQAAQEKKQILVSDVKESHITIKSALGEVMPKSILCTPLLYENEVKGVVELGCLQTFTDLQLEFLKQTTERIAIAIQAAQTRERMKELLEESQLQAEELQAQQEELRVSNEELEEKNQELSAQQEEGNT